MTDGTQDAGKAFRKTVEITALPREGRRFAMEAGPQARRAIAERLEVEDVERLAGEAWVRPLAGGVAVEGRIEGRLMRQCILSLEPMAENIAEEFEIVFRRDAAASAVEGEIEINLDSPEPLEGDSLDLGEILIQQAALAMSPYPRREDATPPAPLKNDESISPFAVLKGAIAPRGKQE